MISVSGPSITEKEVEYVAEAVRRAWYGEANAFHVKFEKAFADYCGRRHAVALPAGYSALHLALLAHDIGPGDEVIVPACYLDRLGGGGALNRRGDADLCRYRSPELVPVAGSLYPQR